MTVDSRPNRVDLNIYAGDNVGLTVSVKNPDGTPGDLTDMTALAQIRLHRTDPEPLAEFDAVVDPAGSITLKLDGAVTAVLPRWALWDCQLMSLSGAVTTVATGSVYTAGEVSR